MKKSPKTINNPVLSIIIVNYNTKKVLADCLDSLKKYINEIDFEVFVSDNGSSDGSIELVKTKYKWVALIENNDNLGFAKANNKAKTEVKGEYILFLNSDTLIHKNTLRETVKYLINNKKIGALTCKIVLPNGDFDKDTRRAFPTPLISFMHFSGLDRILPKSKLFNKYKYWYDYISEDEMHEVDVLQGAFFLTRKNVLDEVGWFNESYFLDGEDIDLSWKIKNAGYKILYYPKVTITHIKKASKKGKRSLKAVLAGVNSMEIFYRKRMWSSYPIYVNYLIILGIRLMKVFRIIKYKII